MRLPYIEELMIVQVLDRDVPNWERIVFKVNQQTDMAKYGVLLGIAHSEFDARPIRDIFYWFGGGFVNPDDWIFLYTGPGEPRVAEIPNSKSKTYTLHWGRKQTVFTSPEIVPVLFRADAVDVLPRKLGLPSGSGQGPSVPPPPPGLSAPKT